jgi:twitching motility protein PilI
MARRSSLRDFQENLSRRIATASSQEREQTKLAAESGESLWILNLPDAGEVMPMPPLAAAPLTRHWFLGIANIRGNLFSVIDFAGFCGKGATPRNAATRLLLVGQRHGVNAGLVFRRVAGLRNERDLKAVGREGAAPAWRGNDYQDGDGRQYTELDVGELMRTPEFLNVAV